jgi:hypothetical protein
MIRGNIAIPDKDPKTWRSRKRRKQPAIACAAIVTPAPMKKWRGPVIRLDTRSAIVEPKKPRNTMLAHLLDDDPEAHRRAGEKADELFREIVRRVAANKRD